jgi:hypothetical protein
MQSTLLPFSARHPVIAPHPEPISRISSSPEKQNPSNMFSLSFDK